MILVQFVFCFFYFILASPVASYFVFTSPVDVGSHVPTAVAFQVDEPADVRWITNISSYSIGLGQSFIKGCAYLCANATLITIHNKTATMPENNGFSWNISSFNLLDVNSSTFWLFSTEGDDLNDTGPPCSEAFNITDKQALDSQTPTAPSTSSSIIKSLPSISSSSPVSAFPSSSSSSSTAPILGSPTKAATNSKSSQKKKDLDVGIIAGIGLLILLVIIGFVVRQRRRKNKHSDTWLRNSSTTSMIFHNNQTPISEADATPARTELPTKFNNRWTTNSTFPAKFELPGEENGISPHAGRFELSAN